MIHLLCPNPALDRTIIMDNFNSNIPLRPVEIRENAGGKSFNVAYALNFFNNTNFQIYTILGGKIGEYVQELSKNVNLKFIKSDVNTRICSIYINKNSNENYFVYEKGEKISFEIQKEYINMVENNLKKGDVVVFSGSLMQGMKDDFIYDFVLKNKDIKVIVDVSGIPLKFAYLSNPYLIKINDEEFIELFKEEFENINNLDIPFEEKIIKILKYKVNIDRIIITMGKYGVIAKNFNNYYKVEIPSIIVKNPIASGDFFLGTLLSDNFESDYEELLKKSSAFSTANCLNYFPEVLKEDFEMVYRQIKIFKL